MVNRQAGFSVPDHRGFTLVGDAQGAHLVRGNTSLGQRFVDGSQLGAPDLHRVVFDPTRLRVNLRQLPLRLRHDDALGVEHNAARTGGALVEGEEVSHAAPLI